MNKLNIKRRMNSKYEHDTEFQSYVSDLLKSERLQGDAVIGIGKKIASEGAENLTEAQVDTFVNFGLKDNYVEYCERCAEEIPWSEMINALDDGYCAYCHHLIEKDD